MRHRHFAGLAFALFALIAFTRAQAATCEGTTQALATMSSAREQLLAIPKTDDYPDPELTEAAQRNIERLKDGVVDLVAARMGCAAGNQDAHALEADLKQALNALPAQCDSACEKREGNTYNDYQAIPDFVVKAWPMHRLAIVAHIPIVCGSDAILFVFEHDGSAWRSRIRWRSQPYKDVSGAFWDFDYRIAPSDEQGRWYVLTKSIKPWCSSTWSQIRYAALRPTDDAARVVYQSEDPIWWGNEDFGTIEAKPHVFDVRFHSASIDTGVHNRLWIRHFTIDGDRVSRVQPVALNPRDFVDEWLVSDWAQAVAWSAPENKALQAWHHRLHGKDGPDFEFGSVRACSGSTRRHEVEIVSTTDEARYYLRVDGAGSFTLTGVSTKADTLCRGTDGPGSKAAK